MNGFVHIQRGQTLQLIVDLEYTPAQVNSEAFIYRLNENRRIKLNEVHYLDHPKFGVVAKDKSAIDDAGHKRSISAAGRPACC